MASESGVRSVTISREMSGIGGGSDVITIPRAKSDFSWRSRSLVGSQSPTHQLLQEELKIHRSVHAIENWWIRMKNRRVFKVLKDAICAAEHSLTQEVLRKVSPMEAELLKDPTIRAKVKFRFGGDTFPPLVLFKVFTSTSSVRGVAGGGVQYISGRRFIKPASEAAEDSRRQMGNRKFYDQMLLDACHHHQLKVTDEVDVTTMKEYMQYAANVDESPAYLGGKENSWRKLNLDVLPRHCLLHNLLEFLDQDQHQRGIKAGSRSNRTTASLERLQSYTRPPSQHEQIERIKTVSSLRSLSPHRPHRTHHGGSRETLRRSRQAQKRVEQMRKAYGLGPTPSPEGKLSAMKSEVLKEEEEGDGGEPDEAVVVDGPNEEMNDIEKEAFELYQWSKDLSFEDIG